MALAGPPGWAGVWATGGFARKEAALSSIQSEDDDFGKRIALRAAT